MSEIRCPRCGGANVVGLEAHPIKLVRYCKDCHDYIANWQQTELSALRDQVQSTDAGFAATLVEYEKQIDALKDELAMANSMVGDLKGCCDHGCMIAPPRQGTNGGKCYCTQGKVRGYIARLRDENAKLHHRLDKLAEASWNPKPRADYLARIEKLEKGLREIKAIQDLSMSCNNYCHTLGHNGLAMRVRAIATATLKEGV